MPPEPCVLLLSPDHGRGPVPMDRAIVEASQALLAHKMPCSGFIKTMTEVSLSYMFLIPGWIRIVDHHLAGV